MDQNKRAIKQKLTRQAKIKKGLSTPFSNKHGMTPKQIHKALQKTGKSKATKEVVRTAKTRPKAANRPQQQRRGPSKNLSLLLDVPVVGLQQAAQYPTPKWFTNNEKADVSVIVPMFKSVKVLEDLVGSWDLKEGMKVELIMVDDACPHNSKEHALALWGRREKELKRPVGKILYNPKNQGFGVSCNIGAAHASAEYLIFLNADTVLTPGWIRPIVRLLKKDEVGVVGNLQVKHGGVWKDTVDSAGSQWDWSTRTFRHIGRDVYNGQPIKNAFRTDNCPADLNEVQEREMVTGACLGIRKELFQSIGGFNPNYRIGYWEDSELCLVVREKGYKVMYQPNSKIFHKGSHSQSGSHKYASHNVHYFANKWLNSGRIDSLVSAVRPTPPREVGNILLRRHSAHGDVLMASAVASALKKKYPHCKVMFNTDNPQILHKNPHVDRTIQTHEISDRMFQLYYNLDAAYEFRPHTNILEAYADVVGVSVDDCELFMHQKEIEVPSEYMVIHAGNTRWAGRNWSPMKWEIIASKLMAKGHTLILVGTGRDHKISSNIDLMNKLSLEELAYLINHARLFVGIDSFPMHVAQTFKTPGVCFFGSIDPATRLVNDAIKPIVANNVPCLGCHHEQPPPCVVTAHCKMGIQECVNNVSINHMMEKIEEVWQTTSAS